MNAETLDKTLTRIAHQVVEGNSNLENFGIVGMQTRGVFLAQRIAKKIFEITNFRLDPGTLDVTLYRDDYRVALKQPEVKVTDIPFDINGKNILLVDDVLYTGRTVRAALDALTDFGRPQKIQLLTLVDRGHRELPIRADYVGKKITTQKNQEVLLRVVEIDNEDSLWLMDIGEE